MAGQEVVYKKPELVELLSSEKVKHHIKTPCSDPPCTCLETRLQATVSVHRVKLSYEHDTAANDTISSLFNMCHNIMIRYTCECIKKSEVVQCQTAKDTGANIKCKPVAKRVDRILA